jgi:toxin ParE1/3/4
MTGYVLSPAAQADIERIWDYTVERWGLAQAERYARAIHVACQELAAGTRSSQAADDIRPGYRKASEGSHVLFFRRLDTGSLNIVRILHQRMDMTRHLS